MSEFSESYHLKGDVNAAVATLERSGLAGWVLPGAGAWTTIVVDREFTSEADEPLIRVAAGVLLLYVLAEDHGWLIEVFADGERRATSQTEWTFDESMDVSGDPPAAVAELLGVDEAVVAPVFTQTDWEEPPLGDLTALVAALGLSNVDWMSGAYLRHGGEADLPPGSVRVDA